MQDSPQERKSRVTLGGSVSLDCLDPNEEPEENPTEDEGLMTIKSRTANQEQKSGSTLEDEGDEVAQGGILKQLGKALMSCEREEEDSEGSSHHDEDASLDEDDDPDEEWKPDKEASPDEGDKEGRTESLKIKEEKNTERNDQSDQGGGISSNREDTGQTEGKVLMSREREGEDSKGSHHDEDVLDKTADVDEELHPNKETIPGKGDMEGRRVSVKIEDENSEGRGHDVSINEGADPSYEASQPKGETNSDEENGTPIEEGIVVSLEVSVVDMKSERSDLCEQMEDSNPAEGLKIKIESSPDKDDDTLTRRNKPPEGHLCQYCNECLPHRSDRDKHERIHKIQTSNKELLQETADSENEQRVCNFCSEVFKNAIECRQHERSHTGNTPYQCFYCMEQFDSLLHKTSHEKSHSSPKQIICKKCGKHFSSKILLEYHKNEHLGIKPFKCQFCEEAFSNKAKWKSHEVFHRKQISYKCSHCQKTFKRKSLLIIHERIHTGEKPFIAQCCGKSFSTSRYRNRHAKLHQKLTHPVEKPYICSVCGKAFSQKKGWTAHENNHSGEKPYECRVCSKKFAWRRSWKRHELLHERPPKVRGNASYPCPHCRKKCSSQSWLARHILTVHTQEKSYTCSVCSKTFSQQKSWALHEKIHSGEKPYECRACSKKFAWKRSFRRHQKLHERPSKVRANAIYPCPHCGKKYSRSYLTRHIKVHTQKKLSKVCQFHQRNQTPAAPKRVHRCSHCEKGFTFKSHLLRHLRTHPGEKPYKCQVCNKCFRESGDLKKHGRIHSGEKPYQCLYCGRCFARLGTLKGHEVTRHMTIGAKKKDHKCSQCGKLFSTKPSLARHVTTHTGEKGEKPYKCLLCDKYFDDKFGLKNHGKVHSGEKPYHCSFCGRCFLRQDNCRLHEVTIHMAQKPEYHCQRCDKVYKRKRHWELHQRSHEVTTPAVKKFCEQDGHKINDLVEESDDQGMLRETKVAVKAGHQCSYCGKLLSSNSAVLRHEMIHTGEKPHQCSMCDKRFADKGDLKKHEITHTGEKPYQCSFCGKCFGRLYGCEKHEALTHMKAEQLYSGQDCDEADPTKRKGQLHEVAQEKSSAQIEKGHHICPYCGKNCFRQSHLARHVMTHTGEKPHQCMVCEKSFREKGDLKKHERIHSGEKPFKCSFCGKCFARVGTRKQHEVVRHMTQKTQYPCQYCGKVYSKQNYLDYHEKNHFVDKKHYVCQYCGKDYTASSSLIRHERTHTGEKPYQCHICSESFIRKDYRDDHLKTHKRDK